MVRCFGLARKRKTGFQCPMCIQTVSDKQARPTARIRALIAYSLFVSYKSYGTLRKTRAVNATCFWSICPWANTCPTGARSSVSYITFYWLFSHACQNPPIALSRITEVVYRLRI